MALNQVMAGPASSPQALGDGPEAGTVPSMAGDLSSQKQALHRQAQMWRKRSHTIKRLRLIFPGAIILIGVVIFGWIVVRSVISAFNVYSPASQDIRMTNPRFFGQTPTGERYEVSGLEAIRHGANTPIINLKAPIMEMKGDLARPNHLEAINGIYNDSTKMFDIKGRVTYTGGDTGMTLKTEAANIDISRNQVTGDGFVEGKWPQGSIQGESFAIYDNGSRIVFHGKGEKQVRGVFNNQ